METKTNNLFTILAVSKRSPTRVYFHSDFGWTVNPKKKKSFKTRGEAYEAFCAVMRTAKGKRDVCTAHIYEGKKQTYSFGSVFSDMFPLRQLRERRRKLIKSIGEILSKEEIDFLGLNGENAQQQWYSDNWSTVKQDNRKLLEKVIEKL